MSRITAVAFAAAILMSLAGPAAAIPAQPGVSYTPWGNDLTQPATFAAFQDVVARMQDNGVQWVALNVFEFQDTLTSTAIGPRLDLWSTPLHSVERAVQEFHARGINVLLKPNVDVADGSWRGNIAGSDAWFNDPDGYKAFVSRWAAWGEAQGVAGLAIGCEFSAAQDKAARWLETIALARGAFSGWLTYAANWDAYRTVSWWSALDYIGIDAYFPLTALADPTLAQLIDAWNYWLDDPAAGIQPWLLSLPPADRKQVLFTEIGYRSIDGANIAPWAWSPYGPDNLDLQEQADCYAAAFSATIDRSWLDGYYWWNWETYPQPGDELWNDYTPQNKPAEFVLRHYYTPEPASALLLAAGLAALARRRRDHPRAG